MTGEQGNDRPWDSFYARTAHLPSPELTSEFLTALPHGARLLDFGAGSGAWTAGFLRDRTDLAIDVLDQNIEHAQSLPEGFAGQRLAQRFQDYRATDASYDAIWARSVLFFMPRKEMESCFHELSASLVSGGTIAFTMVDDCPAAALCKFNGMSESSMLEILDREGLELVKVSCLDAPYGAKRISIPTFDVTARKR